MLSSVPHETFCNCTVVVISPGRFGSSNLSEYLMDSLVFISKYSPPKECPFPVLKLIKLILKPPPTLKSICCTVHRKPYGGNQKEVAIGSANARNTFSGLALITLCKETVLFFITTEF